jgi:hypothetical protein
MQLGPSRRTPGSRLRLQRRCGAKAHRVRQRRRLLARRHGQEARPAASAIWIMVPSGDPVDQTIAKLEALHESRRHPSSTAATPTTRTPAPPRRSSPPRASSSSTCGTSGGVWGISKRATHDDRRRQEHPSKRLTPIFETLAPAADEGWGHVGPPAPATSSRWCTTASSTASCRPTPRASPSSRPRSRSTSTSCRSPRSGATARRPLLAARPHRRRAQEEPHPRRSRSLRARLRRRPLDRLRSHRPQRLRARHHRVAHPPPPFARRKQLHRPHALHHAQRVRRPRRQERLANSENANISEVNQSTVQNANFTYEWASSHVHWQLPTESLAPRARRQAMATMKMVVRPEDLSQVSKGSERTFPDPCVVVIFGASGDLTKRKLLPALYPPRAAEPAARGVRRRRRSPPRSFR